MHAYSTIRIYTREHARARKRTHTRMHMVYFGNHYFNRNSGALLPEHIEIATPENGLEQEVSWPTLNSHI